MSARVETFTVCPSHTDVFGVRPEQAVAGTDTGDGAGTAADAGRAYVEMVAAHCAAAERLGASAVLIYDFWQSLDPWLAGQLVLAASTTLEPIVAVNPALAHPAIAARSVAGLCHLYGRRVNLNVVAGAKAAELEAFGLEPAKDGKYERMTDFIDALRAVLGGEPHSGPCYRLRAGPPSPVPDPALAPRVLAPGSRSPEIAAVLPRLDRALVMAKPRADLGAEHDRLAAQGLTGGLAMIVGIVARETDERAWETAERQYSATRRDALTRRLFARQVTSSQHHANLDLAEAGVLHDECLWYGAGRIGIDCPKLVGSYKTVATALDAYQDQGVRTVVLDLPYELAEYDHVARALEP